MFLLFALLLRGMKLLLAVESILEYIILPSGENKALYAP